MPVPFEVLAEQVLRLPVEQRSELLDRVVASLDPTALDPEWERAWADEVDRREAEIASGAANWIAGDQVVESARSRAK